MNKKFKNIFTPIAVIYSKKIFWLLITAVYMLRIFSAIQDGISDRYFETENILVGWYAFHVIGWLCRDVIQLVLLYLAGKAKGFEYTIQWVKWYSLHTLLNWGLHLAFYHFAANNRHLFTW